MPDIDHRLVEPPYLRVSHEMKVHEATIRVFDLRIGQPNVSHVPVPVIHSLEHFLGTLLRDASRDVAMVGVMGCQTGLYIVTVDLDRDDLTILLETALKAILVADEVPLANHEQCGWVENHSLVGAQEVASWLLRHRDALTNVTDR